MAAEYDLFRTPQLKSEDKVRYHTRSVVTGRTSTRDWGTSCGKFIVTFRLSG